MMTDLTEARFWSFVPLGAKNECWVWGGFRTERGYGRMKVGTTPFAAHRLMWVLVNGSIPTGKLVCHHCDNPPCVNPNHLFLGDQSDNMYDMMQKMRHPSCKLSAKDREKIMFLRSMGIPQKTMANEFMVSEATISNICRGKYERV